MNNALEKMNVPRAASPDFEERMAAFDAIRDEDIDYSDIPDLADDEDFWKEATFGWPPPKKVHMTMRMDEDIIEYFKKHPDPRGYQSRINRVLRVYVNAQLRAQPD